jgi:MFS family permease
MCGFALGFGSLLLVGWRVIEQVGTRRAYLAALTVFVLASVIGGAWPTELVLVVTRLVKGACAALTAPTGLAVIGATFPAGPARNRALAVYSMVGASGFAVGLLASGLLTTVDWRWVFAAPAPVGLVLLGWAARVLPKDEVTGHPAPPLARLGLLTRVSVLRPVVGAATLNGAYWGLLFIGTFRLPAQFGWSAVAVALAFLPPSLLLAGTVPFAGRLTKRFGAARLVAAGASAVPIGCGLWLPSALAHGYLIGVLPTMVLLGVGFALAFPILHHQATSLASAEDRPAASSLYQAAVQFGGALVLLSVAVLLRISADYQAAVSVVTTVGVIGFLVAIPEVLHTARNP